MPQIRLILRPEGDYPEELLDGLTGLIFTAEDPLAARSYRDFLFAAAFPEGRIVSWNERYWVVRGGHFIPELRKQKRILLPLAVRTFGDPYYLEQTGFVFPSEVCEEIDLTLS